MSDGSGAGAALGGAIAGHASKRATSPAHGLAAKAHDANKKADKLDAEKDTPCKTCGCPAETMKANVLKCDGGSGVWDRAKAAYGKDPQIKVGRVSGANDDYHGQVGSDKKITIAPTENCCQATQYLVIELNNLANSSRFAHLDSDAAAGEVGREDYAKYKERIEYDAVVSSANVYDSCQTAWGCADGGPALYAGARSSSFDNYYDRLSNSNHTNEYRQDWDRDFSDAFDAKNKKPR